MKEEQTLRFTSLGILLTLLPILIFYRIVSLQLDPEIREPILDSLIQNQNENRKIVPVRGEIVDRKGQLMASNQRSYEVGIDLNRLVSPHEVALALNLILGREVRDLEEDIAWAQEKGYNYLVADDFVSQEQIDKLDEWIKKTEASNDPKEAISLRGIRYSKHLKRSYPNQKLAANIMGFVGWEDKKEEQSGIHGVEGYYNDMLAGKVYRIKLPRIPDAAQDINLVPEGASLVLTLDREIQAMTEDVLDHNLKRNGSDSGTIIIMDPLTGEILAMATTPRLDPNRYWEFLDEYPKGVSFNQAISQPYEPGSVFKPLTVAAALDSGSITSDFNYVDQGVLEYAGAYIYNWNRGAWGPQDLLGCLQHSLNVCLATLSTKHMGNDVFYDYMKRFGIGHKTGIDMEGEISGFLKTPNEGYWHESDLATNAFGQGLTTTPLQMAMAISALANEGQMMVPHIVKSYAQLGYQTDIDQRIAGVPVRSETARMLTDLLTQSLVQEASDALVPGYSVAGKTGTAQFATESGYHPYLTNASFVGYGPVDHPRFLVYIWFEKPQSSPWGSEVAAPVFSELVQKLVVLMDIPPDDIRMKLLGQ